MQIERGASNTFALLGRSILSPSYWLLWFRDPERNASVYCIATASNTTGGMLTLTFTETNTPTALDGEVKLSPRGNWELKVYEQTSPTNLDPANAGRLVKTIGLLVVGPEASDTGWSGTACPTDGDECDPLSYSLVNSDNLELDGGSVPDPCGENLTLNAPDATIRTTNTLLNVAQAPSGSNYDLPQTSVMYENAFGITQLFLTDTTFDGVHLQTTDHILTADLLNSLGNVVAAAKVTAADLMNNTVPIAPDGTITFDGLAVGTVPSGDTENLDCGTLLNAAYVQDGGSVTGTYLVTGTLNGRNVYTLDGTHNLEYTGTRWRLVKPGSDVDAALGSQTFPWLADWSATSVTVEQATIGSYCGGDEVPCADLTVAINGTTYGTVADPCGATAAVNVHDSNGNDVGSLVGGAWVVAPPSNVLREYTTGGSWSKPTNASFQGVWVFAAGGGGSGGAGNVNSTNTTGGSGGGGGSLVRVWVPAASLLTTETYAIGSGAVSVATGNGSAGGATLFGAHVEAKGGNGGNGGSTSAGTVGGGTGGAASLNTPVVNGSSISGATGGTGGRTNAAATVGVDGLISSAAPGGGGAAGVNASASGGNGRAGGGTWSTSLTAGGAGGVSSGGNGTAGVDDIYLNPFLGLVTSTIGIGTGGGGGAGATGATAGGTGGAGGRGAGGGGGGGTQTGTRGASGAGGNGFLLVYEVFAI